MNFTIKAKVILAMVAGIVLLMAVVIFFNLRDHKNAVADLIASMKKDINETTLELLSAKTSLLKSSIEIIIHDGESKKMFKDGERDALYKKFQNLFKKLQQDHGVTQLQYNTKHSVTFLRYHNPSKYGDELASYRTSIVEVNRSKKEVSGIEVGSSGLGLRVVSPLFLNEEHIGVVEIGSGLNDILSNISKSMDLEYAVAYCKPPHLNMVIISKVFQK